MMMRTSMGLGLLLGVAVLGSGLGGCASTPTEQQVRADPTTLIEGDKGLQSKDLVEMTDKMAPSILQKDVIARNPYKVVIVTTGIDNKTNNPGEDLTIYVARIQGLLMEHATDRVSFVENRTTLDKLIAAEGAAPAVDPFEQGSRGAAAPANPRMVAGYALHGVFYQQSKSVTSFYLCQFKLTDMRTGEIVWQGNYEVRTLN